MELLNSKKNLVISGMILGLLAAVLAFFGNPGNMAICVACFIRDMAGGLKLHNAPVVQYIRPEIVGFVLGSFFIAIATKEYRSMAGSSPMTRFLLGFIMMIGSLVFLGCPLRMLIRMSAGDLNAYVGLIGFIGGIFTGVIALKRGFSLGKATETKKSSGYILPALLVIILIVSVTTTLFAQSTEGPGSMHAPVILSLILSMIFGAICQKNRTCFAGSIRDIFILKNFDLISIIGGFFIIMIIYNISQGKFNLSFTGQPVAHSQHIWNIIGLYIVGFSAVLAGGCPLRQLILAGQGSSDSGATFLGLLIGGAMCHNIGLASAAAKAATETEPAVLGGPSSVSKIVCVLCIVVLFVIGFSKTGNLKKM